MKTMRRRLFVLAGIALLAGCKVIPGSGPKTNTPPPTDGSTLPADGQRHRVALLVPMSGPNAAAGLALANAATMAVIDANAKTLRITNYDTSAGAAEAAARAIADGNRLILGPLSAEDVPAVSATAASARVPVLSFANDERVAGRGVFVMGNVPAQSIARSVSYARLLGASRFAAMVPVGNYGQGASTALLASVRAAGGTVSAIETFDRTVGAVSTAARRLKAKGGYDAVLIADGGRFSAQAAPLLKTAGATSPRILGTELWNGDAAILRTPALRGALFASVSDGRFAQFSSSYRARFGSAPPRLATMGYDAVLLTVRLAREWKPGTPLPVNLLTQSDGFLGIDGPFRFTASGVIERALEVREVGSGTMRIASPAPATFGN